MLQEKNSQNRLLGVADAADRLGLSPLTLYRWIATRRIGVCRLGRAVRISEGEVARLIEEGSRPARRER